MYNIVYILQNIVYILYKYMYICHTTQCMQHKNEYLVDINVVFVKLIGAVVIDIVIILGYWLGGAKSHYRVKPNYS